MHRQADDFSASHQLVIEHIILVAHNGKVFDIPFFMRQLSNYEMLDFFFEDKQFGFGIDSLQVAKKSAQKKKSVGVPTAFNLPTLYQFLTGNVPVTSHRALGFWPDKVQGPHHHKSGEVWNKAVRHH